jgi:asparagine synthetase B (glutamine-hydrolysing)
MPGIVGFITKRPRVWAEPQLLRMVEALRHKPFHVMGTWIDESMGIYVGWVARKDSFADGMPLRSERGDVLLVFSGEEFPEPGTRQALKDKGHAVEPLGASYLVHQYEENPAFINNLNGRFHGLLVDLRKRAATLFNDRIGMHRLYYHEAKDAFYFAAEAKAILAVRPELRRPNPQSLGEFLACSCVLEDRTLFEGIYALPPGSAWEIRDASVVSKARYFDPREWSEQEPLAPEAYYQQLRETFSKNLPRYFNGKQNVGMALTGGLDTRIIMAWRKPSPNTLPCYTFGGPFREAHDVRVARKIAGLCKQPHSVIPMGADFFSRFSQYAELCAYHSEGTVDLSRAPDLYYSEHAEKIAPVKVVGTYGSEILQRCVMFKPMPLMPGLFNGDLSRSVQQAANTYAALRREDPVMFAAFRQSPWYHHGVLMLEQTYLSVRSPYLDNGFLKTVFRAPKNHASNDDVRLRLIADGSRTLSAIPTDRGVVQSDGPLSAAARFILEFSFKAEYAYDYGMPNWLARLDHLCAPLHLERCFLGRHKHLHFRLWYRDALAGYVKDVLLDPKTLSRPYIDRKVLESMVAGHLSGNENHTMAIHKTLSLELLHRLFFDAR